MRTEEIYAVVAARMRHHAGSVGGLMPVPAAALATGDWLREDLDTARRMYGRCPVRTLGTVRWYSASSVLVAPALESLVLAGAALDPALGAVTLDVHPDGRYAGARSARVLDGSPEEVGAALGDALAEVIAAAAPIASASEPAFWAIAADSIANRLLWAGSAAGSEAAAMDLAGRIADGVGPRMPRPRYADVGRAHAVRRASCCLIYEIPGGQKCVSCPRQTPSERNRRLRAALG